MNPNQKALLSLASFLLVLVTIACSCGSLLPVEEDSTQVPDEPVLTGPTVTLAVIQSGPPSIEQVSGQITVPAGESGTVSAACPAGSVRLGGGFASGAGMQITKTMPDESNGWIISGLNGSEAELALTAYAYCLHNDSGSIRVAFADEPVSGGPRAVCQEGEIITGGGYAYDTDSLKVHLSTPNGDSLNPGNFWSIMAQSLVGADQTIRVYAVCLSGSSLTSTLVRDERATYVQGTDSVSVTETCPSGAVMAGGGYEGQGVFVSRIDLTDAMKWEVQVQEKIYFDGSLDHAVCLNLP